MVVQVSPEFLKELKKYFDKNSAIKLLYKLKKTTFNEGKFIALVGNIVIKEKKQDSFRFYFITKNDEIRIITKKELKTKLIRFIAISKKNNQQKVIDKLKESLKKTGFRFD